MMKQLSIAQPSIFEFGFRPTKLHEASSFVQPVSTPCPALSRFVFNCRRPMLAVQTTPMLAVQTTPRCSQCSLSLPSTSSRRRHCPLLTVASLSSLHHHCPLLCHAPISTSGSNPERLSTSRLVSSGSARPWARTTTSDVRTRGRPRRPGYGCHRVRSGRPYFALPRWRPTTLLLFPNICTLPFNRGQFLSRNVDNLKEKEKFCGGDNFSVDTPRSLDTNEARCLRK